SGRKCLGFQKTQRIQNSSVSHKLIAYKGDGNRGINELTQIWGLSLEIGKI
ncbi:1154_t:CDS:1, partial [Funneliformis mosseae]